MLSAVRLREERHDYNAMKRIPCPETKVSIASSAGLVFFIFNSSWIQARIKEVNKINCRMTESYESISKSPLGGAQVNIGI